MAKPTLLTVHDDPNLLKAIETNLRARYGEKYRVLRANSGDSGLEILRELRVRNDVVALLLADRRMPQMDGIGFLNEARKVYPDAKRALLTAYADTLPSGTASRTPKRNRLATSSAAKSLTSQPGRDLIPIGRGLAS
jgi:response regulator RpfG family c-di-GMP phosphodiesterase